MAGCLTVLGGGIAGTVMVLKAREFLIEGMDPIKARQILNEIIPCSAPMGYTPFFGQTLKGMRMAWIARPGEIERAAQTGENPTMIMMISMPEKQPKDSLKSSMQAMPTGMGVATVVKTETETLTIRGQPVEAERSIVIDMKGKRVLQYAILLEQEPTPTNPAGQELITISGGEATFDRRAMDAFLKSIR